jgi:hypothetical protein
LSKSRSQVPRRLHAPAPQNGTIPCAASCQPSARRGPARASRTPCAQSIVAGRCSAICLCSQRQGFDRSRTGVRPPSPPPPRSTGTDGPRPSSTVSALSAAGRGVVRDRVAMTCAFVRGECFHTPAPSGGGNARGMRRWDRARTLGAPGSKPADAGRCKTFGGVQPLVEEFFDVNEGWPARASSGRCAPRTSECCGRRP